MTASKRLASVVTLLSFTVTTLAPSLAWAIEREAPGPARLGVGEVHPEELQAGHEKAEAVADELPVKEDEGIEARPDREELQSSLASGVAKKPAADVQVEATAVDTAGLPTGADKSGVTSQAISVPKGSGTVQGMGESFSAQLSTGIATFSVPFALPAARGGAQPSLGLSYSSGSGSGLAGMG